MWKFPQRQWSLYLSEVKQWQLWEINPVGPRKNAKRQSHMLFLTLLHFYITFLIICKKKKQQHKDRKEHPLSSSTFTERPSSSIHTNNQTMLLVVVCPNSTWLHSHRNPFYINSHEVNFICTPRHFFLLQTTIIGFKSKSSFPTSFMLQWRRCFRLQGREG